MAEVPQRLRANRSLQVFYQVMIVDQELKILSPDVQKLINGLTKY